MSTPPKQFYIARAGYSRTQKLLNGALLFEVPESLRLVSELGAPTFEVDGLGTGNTLKVVFGRLPGEPPNRWLPLWLRLSWWFRLLFNPFWGRPVAIIKLLLESGGEKAIFSAKWSVSGLMALGETLTSATAKVK